MFNKEEKERLEKVEQWLERVETQIAGLHLNMKDFREKLDAKPIPVAKMDVDRFPENVEETKKFKDLVTKTNCPACGHKKLLLDLFTRTPEGWQATLHCENCIFKGTVNSDGFSFLEMHGRGTAESK